MTYTKEMISTDIEIYVAKITYINSCIEIYDYLDISRVWHNEKVNIAPAFFGLTMSTLARSLILETCILFGQKEDKSIKKLLNICENNMKIMGNDIVSRSSVENNGVKQVIKTSERINIKKTISDLKNEHCGLSDIVDKIKLQRDKVLAHSDKEFFYDIKKMSRENPVSTSDCKILMDFALRTCNLFYKVLNDGRTFTGIYKNVNDIECLFNALSKNGRN